MAVDTVVEILQSADRRDSKALLAAVEEGQPPRPQRCEQRSKPRRNGDHPGGRTRNRRGFFDRERGAIPPSTCWTKTACASSLTIRPGSTKWAGRSAWMRTACGTIRCARAHHGDRREHPAYRELLLDRSAAGSLVLIWQRWSARRWLTFRRSNASSRAAARHLARRELPKTDRRGEGGGRSR